MSEEYVMTGPQPGPEESNGAAARAPGAVLRAAREAASLSVDDVAQVLRFSPRQIECLEADDYAGLPGATVVRGFIRSYAKLLKLDPAPLLHALDPAVPAPATEVVPPNNMGEAGDTGIAERASPRVLALGLLAVAVALIAFWYLTLPRGETSSSGPGSTAQVAAPVAPSAAEAPATAPVPPVVAVDPAAPVATLSAPPGAAPIAPTGSGLRIEFDDRSWIEVKDATQKILLAGEYPGGTKHAIDGTAPFQVWIGKASSVRLFIGDRSVDLKPHTREEVARLTVE